MTASACAVVSTMLMGRSTRAATPAAEPITVAPRVRHSSVLAGSTSCTTSEKPCLTRFWAIGPPIAPRPMKPTVPGMVDRLPRLDGGPASEEPAPGTILRRLLGGERAARRAIRRRDDAGSDDVEAAEAAARRPGAAGGGGRRT